VIDVEIAMRCHQVEDVPAGTSFRRRRDLDTESIEEPQSFRRAFDPAAALVQVAVVMPTLCRLPDYADLKL
jgi:hypothetical protein